MKMLPAIRKDHQLVIHFNCTQQKLHFRDNPKKNVVSKAATPVSLVAPNYFIFVALPTS